MPAMNAYHLHYIDGRWTPSVGGTRHEVVNPATEEVVSTVTLGTAADVDAAVKAARRAFESFSQTSKADRLALLGRIVEEYKKRIPDIAKAISEEMGAPISIAQTA
jgi:aldehyde dehydrogenase (NAD+)